MDVVIKFAPSDEVVTLEHWVGVILEALGHPEAMVTDESFISDFSPFSGEDVLAEWHADVQAALGMEFPLRGTSIVELARQVKAKRAH